MNETDSQTETSYDVAIPLEPEFNALLHSIILMALTGVSIGLFVLINVLRINNGLPACFVIVLAPILMVYIVGKRLGEPFLRGVLWPVAVGLPLSVLSYVTESAYQCCVGQFFCTCPPRPDWYYLPKMAAVVGALVALVMCVYLPKNGKKAGGFGMFTGLLIATWVFLFATIAGGWLR